MERGNFNNKKKTYYKKRRLLKNEMKVINDFFYFIK